MDIKSKNGITVIIPAHNEEKSIGDVVDGVFKVLGKNAQVIVVDDMSTDRTGDIAEEHGAEVIKHPYRKGNGASIKTGVRHARKEITVFLDGDGQHPPEDIPRLIEPLGMYEMVIGARQNFQGISRLRTIGNWVYNILATYVTNMNIQDLTSGFRAIKTNVIKKYLFLLPNGFSYPTTITLATIKAGYSVKFVPFNCRARVGNSKLRPFKDGAKFFVILLKIATLFSPMKIFAPISAVFMAGGLVIYGVIFSTASRFPKTSLLLFIVGAMIFLMGLIAEQIAMLRMETRE